MADKDKVLVVDDEWEARAILRTLLAEEGYNVILASNGEEAIELAEREDPKVILLDVRMPGIDGIETCRRLKAQEKTKSIPIIMITVAADKHLDAFVEGADDFVTKPFHAVDLSFRIKSVLRIRHLTEELERAKSHIDELEKRSS